MRTRALALLLPFLLPLQLMAIPAWARLTGASCNTCHMTPTLQLTFQGREFLRNGHRLEPAGFDKADAKWDNYLSMEWDLGAAKTPGSSVSVDQPAAEIFAGGPISEHLSFKGEVDITFSGNGQSSDLAVDNAYLQYNQVIPGGFISARAGQIYPEVVQIWGVVQPGSDQFFGDTLGGAGLKGNATTAFSSNQGFDVKVDLNSWIFAGGLLNGAATNTPADKGYHNDSYFSAMYQFKKWLALGAYHFNGSYNVYQTDGDTTTPFLFLDRYDTNALFATATGQRWRVTAVGYGGRDQVAADGTKIRNGGSYLLGTYNFTDTLGVYARADAYKPDRSQPGNLVRQQMVGVNGFLHLSDRSGSRWALEYSRVTLEASDTTTNQVAASLFWIF